VEIDGNGDTTGPVDGEIGGVPLGAVGGEEGDAVAGLDAQFDEGHGKTGYSPQEFRGCDGFQVLSGWRNIWARGFGLESMAFRNREGRVP